MAININRREFLGALAIGFGTSLTPLAAKAFELVANSQNGVGNVLNKRDLKTVELIVDIIIPTTDTPGASAANVHHFINYLLSFSATKQEKQDFLAGLNALNSATGGFNQLTADKQYQTIQTLDDNRFNDPFYLSLKQITVLGYYTSEIGASMELNYDPVPGPYKEIPLSDVGKAWF